MIEDLPDVPPALLMLLREVSSSKSWSESRKRVKAMLFELRDQSEVFVIQNTKREKYKRDPTRFEVHLHGALDLLSGQGCMEPDCRLDAADRVARSVGLIADRVWLTDTLSTRLMNFGRVTNAKLDEVIADTLVLGRVFPLIAAGIIKFRSPWMATCNSCAANFDMQMESVTVEVLKTFRRDLKVKRRGDGGFDLYAGKSFDSPMVFCSLKNVREQYSTERVFVEEFVRREVRSTLWVAREAALTGGSLFTNSRIGLSGLLQPEGRLPDRRTLLMFEKERQFVIPWVSELNASQIIQLREEASSALPAFRDRIARAMSVSQYSGPNSNSTSIIEDLREQANDVRAELIAKQAHSSKYWKTTYGLLGLSLSAYGVASDQILPGVAGLLPILHLLINHQTGHEAEIAKLTSKPGFVMVKAQDILAHAH